MRTLWLGLLWTFSHHLRRHPQSLCCWCVRPNVELDVPVPPWHPVANSCSSNLLVNGIRCCSPAPIFPLVGLCNSLCASQCLRRWTFLPRPRCSSRSSSAPFLRDRLVAAASLLSVCHVHGLSLALAFLPMLVSRGTLSYILCESQSGNLFQCHCSIHPDSAPFWALSSQILCQLHQLGEFRSSFPGAPVTIFCDGLCHYAELTSLTLVFSALILFVIRKE